jgi:mono/diheme cytochrome c family protein
MDHPVRRAFGRALRCAAWFGALTLLAGPAMAQSTTPAPAAAAPSQAALLARGKVLMEGIVACGNCHVARGPQGEPLFDKGLSGGMVFDEPPFRAVASNITPDAATGIGRWTDAQLARAIREGIRPDGTVIGPPMPMEFYRHLADSDLAAIVAWLRAQPAVASAPGKSVYRIALPPSYGPPITAPVAVPPTTDTLRYGEYLANIGHCMDCHTPRSPEGRLLTAQLGAGGMPFPGPWGVSVARNLTPHESGLKGWTDAEIARAIRTGVRRDGTPLKPPMAFGWYANIGDADMAALIGYLRSLKPQAFAGK